MKFIILSQYYLPEVGAPSRRLSDLAERMVQKGHEVTVLTAMPNYPHGKIYDGYGGLTSQEEINGVKILRSFIYPTQRSGIIPRLLSYFSFVFSAMLIGSFRLKRADYLMVESPPLFLGIAAVWLNWLKGKHVIFNVSDLWPESAVSIGMIKRSGYPYRLSSWLERVLYQQAWLVSGQSPETVGNIKERYPEVNTYLLTNGVNLQQFGVEKASDEAREVLTREPEDCIVLYAGLHGLAQGLAQVIEAASQLRDQDHIKFILVGDGPDKQHLLNAAQEAALDNIRFLDGRPFEQIPPLLASTEIIMVILIDEILGAIPSKLYEAMASQRPVIFVGKGGGAEIVAKYEAGIVVEPNNIGDFVSAVKYLQENHTVRETMGENGRRAVEEYYNRQRIFENFHNLLTNDTIL